MNSHRKPPTRTPAPSAPVAALVPVLAIALLAALPAPPAAAEDPGMFSGQFVIGYRSVDVGGREAKYKEDYNYEDGPRLFDLSFHFLPADSLRGLADRVDLDVTNFGGDPYETLHLGVQKFGAFNFRYDRTESTYYYQDQLIPPEVLDVRLSNGGDFHYFDFQRVRDTARLDLDVSKRAKVNFGFERFTKIGESSTTLDIQRDEFELEKPIDESLNAYSGGFQYAWEKVTLVVQEEVRDYENAYEIFLPGFSEGENTANAANLDFFFLDQPYDFNSRTHTVRLLAHPNPKLSLRVGASIQNLDLDVTADERQQGTGFNGLPFATTADGRGEISRDTDRYELGLSYRLNDRFTLLGGAYSRSLDQEGIFLFDAFGLGRWKIDTDGGELGLQVSVSPEVTVSAGVRSERRDVVWYTSEGGVNIEESTDHTGYFGTLAWRPSRAFRLNASVESSTYDDPFTLSSPTDRTRYRVRGQYNFARAGFIAGTYLRSDSDNDNSGWDSTHEQFNLQLGYQRPGLSGSIGYGMVSLDRSILQGTNVGDFDIAYEADADFIDGRLRWNPVERWTLGATARHYDNGGSFALRRTDYSGFVEYAFEQGYLVRLGYRSIDYDEEAFNFDDYDADIAEFAVGYRW